MSETREAVIMDITMLTKFATVQRLKDLNKSAFSRSRRGIDIDAFKILRHPAMPALSRRFFDSYADPKTSTGNQRIEKILDAFATIFAGSGSCVAVGAIRDWENKVLYMIIGGNGTISQGQQEQIHKLYVGLKEIAAASEQITDRQILPKHSDVLEDSPPTKKYESSSRKLYELLRLRILIICILPYPTPFSVHYVPAPKLIIFSLSHKKLYIPSHGHSTLSQKDSQKVQQIWQPF